MKERKREREEYYDEMFTNNSLICKDNIIGKTCEGKRSTQKQYTLFAFKNIFCLKRFLWVKVQYVMKIL